jgi:PucR-like helix-turn-helix protein
MRELVGRLAALDPDAGAAVQVIAYFDQLTQARAGLEAVVRGAAVLSGCPARLADPDRRLHVRVTPDGQRKDLFTTPDPDWLSVPVTPDGPTLWLEKPDPAGPVEAMVLERAAAAVGEVLDRAWGRAAVGHDPALVELLLDATAPEPARLRAARRLGLSTTGLARAIAVEGVGPVIGSGDKYGASDTAAPPVSGRRAGVGPAVPVLDLPASWREAQAALRLTADGTEQDPGARVVYADEMGGLTVLAAAVGPETPPAPDVHALERAASAAPWMLVTLHAVATTASLRAASTALTVHHSTLQDRLTHAERVLGWSVRDVDGKLRLQLALALRRIHRS